MKKYINIFVGLFLLMFMFGVVYSTVTTASDRKSTKIPWQGVKNGYYDSFHNVGTSYLPETRFSIVGGGSKGLNKVVSDSVTGLMWMSVAITEQATTCKTYDTNDFLEVGCNDGVIGDKCNWCAAKKYCEDLSWGGYDDWKLPNIRELVSILDYGLNDGAGSYSYQTYFDTLLSAYYWSSTKAVSSNYGESGAYAIYIGGGYTTGLWVQEDRNVICNR